MRSVGRARRAGLATVLFAATAGSLYAPRRRGESSVMNAINRTADFEFSTNAQNTARRKQLMKRGDEISAIMESVHSMRQSLRDIIARIQNSSDNINTSVVIIPVKALIAYNGVIISFIFSFFSLVKH